MLITEKLNEQDHMTETERTIAQFFLKNTEHLTEMSARFIASEIYTAPSTIVRFCQRIGFKGFNEFKKAYLEETSYLNAHFKNIDPNSPFDEKDRYVTIASKLSVLYQETAVDTLALMNHDILQKVTRMLTSCENIFVCSAGDAIEVGRMFKNRMIKIGKRVVVEERTDNLFYEACYADKSDCFILLSYSGETDRLLKVAKKLSERNIPSIAVTSYGNNSLSEIIPCAVYTSTREKLIDNLGNFSAMLSFAYIMDTFYACVFNENYALNQANKLKSSLENEQYRKSTNPIIADRFKDI